MIRKNPPRACYFAAEIADMLGLSVDAFYEQRQDLHDKKGMPASATFGRIRIPKAPFDTWLKDVRKEPPRRPANDTHLSVPQTDQDHRAYLRAHYQSR